MACGSVHGSVCGSVTQNGPGLKCSETVLVSFWGYFGDCKVKGQGEGCENCVSAVIPPHTV